MRLRLWRLLLALWGAAFLASPAAAQDSDPGIDYVRVCSLYGVGFYYIPGTEVCIHIVTGDQRQQTEYGTLRTWSPLVLQLMDETAAADRAIEAAGITMAIPMPIILAGDRFAIAVNWSYLAAGYGPEFYEARALLYGIGHLGGYHAVGFAGAVAVSDALSVNVGVGVGLQHFAIGTRFGLNLNW